MRLPHRLLEHEDPVAVARLRESAAKRQKTGEGPAAAVPYPVGGIDPAVKA